MGQVCAEQRLIEHLDKQDIIELVTTSVSMAEQGRWDILAGRYDDEVTIVYDIAAGESIMTRARYVAWSRAMLSVFDATQHLVTNVFVELAGELAQASAYVRATHRVGSDLWIVGGIYKFLVGRNIAGGWVIKRQQLVVLYEEGMTDMAAISRKKAEQFAAYV